MAQRLSVTAKGYSSRERSGGRGRPYSTEIGCELQIERDGIVYEFTAQKHNLRDADIDTDDPLLGGHTIYLNGVEYRSVFSDGPADLRQAAIQAARGIAAWMRAVGFETR